MFDLKYLFFPYNYKNVHWSGVAVFVEEKKIKHYDSIGHQSRNAVVSNIVMEYLKDEHYFQYQKRLHAREWTLDDTDIDTPRQVGGK